MQTMILALWQLLGIDPFIHSSRVPKLNRKLNIQRKAIRKKALEREFEFEVEFEDTFDTQAKPAFGQYGVEVENISTGAVPVNVTAKHPAVKKFENKVLAYAKNNY